MTDSKNYWGFRIEHRAKLYHEMKDGRLRQGWGSVEGQDLRKHINKEDDAEDYEGIKRNLRMFREVKKGDIILVPVPHPIDWKKIAIVEATDDWDEGYRFDTINIKKEGPGYGHVFPVKYLREFYTHSPSVHGDIRSTFRAPPRFWSINRCAEHIEKILAEKQENLDKHLEGEEKLEDAINTAFNQIFGEEPLEKMLTEIQGKYRSAEWEQGLKLGLEKLTQTTNGFRVETTANKTEKEHGADLLIYFPNPIDESIQYVIAVQVKDHKGVVSTNAVKQISKAEEYFAKKGEGLQLIEKMVVITNAEKIDNNKIKDEAAANNVKILFKKDFELLLTRIANSYITLKPQEY